MNLASYGILRGGWDGYNARNYAQVSWGNGSWPNAFTTASTGGTETRPMNIALVYCVKMVDGGDLEPSGVCVWRVAPGGCVTGATKQITECNTDEYVRSVKTYQVCHIADNTYKTKTDLYCCKF